MVMDAKIKKGIIFMIVLAVTLMLPHVTFCKAATPAVVTEAETATETQSAASDSDILFDGEPDNTGNSAGEIVFMLVIVGVCLFFVVEAIVSWIKKRTKE